MSSAPDDMTCCVCLDNPCEKAITVPIRKKFMFVCLECAELIKLVGTDE